ncbi:VanW family protein [Peptococcaceae bacterium 1198_IL3148]
MKKKFNTPALIWALLLGQLIIGVTVGTASLKYSYQDKIIPGVTISGVDVGGMRSEDALVKIKDALPQPTPTSNLLLKDQEGNGWTIQYGDVELSYDYQGAISEAYKLSKNANPLIGMTNYYKLMQGDFNLPLKVKFNEAALRQILAQQKATYDIQPINAKIANSEGKVVLLSETLGKFIDINATVESFANLDVREHQVELVTKAIEPQLTDEDLKDINTQLSIYVTALDSSSSSRIHNIKLASNKIDNTLMKPGEVFSLNQQLGPRIEAEGYQKASVIVDNEIVDDYGGGVCQVATTLYNAVKVADLPVVERHRHTLPVDYAPIGEDATIAGDIKDFKFKNDGKKPLLIKSAVEENKLTVSLFGNKDDAKNVQYKIETERKLIKHDTIYKSDNSLKPGEVKVEKPGQDGYDIITYEVTIINGAEVERKQISERHIKPETAVIVLPAEQQNIDGYKK